MDSAYALFRNNNAIKLLYQYKPANLFLIKASWPTMESILRNEQIRFVDLYRKPKEELVLSNLDLDVNKVNLVHSLFPAISGSGTVLSLKEEQPDTTDIDIKGRYLSTSFSSSTTSTHASDMATIIAGAGNSWFEGRGVAWGAHISSASFDRLLPEDDSDYSKYGITVQNHSYGTGIENYYGADAQAYDASVFTRKSLLHVFSAGNEGTNGDTIGSYKGLSGYANITGSFKMAKNILTVGNINSVYEVLPKSSRGPAYDGRVKPELVAYAEDGSSGAAAIVSGISLILQQEHLSVFGVLPDASLIKAILINSADYIDPGGISFVSGYGNVNALKAIETIHDKRIFSGSVDNGQTVSYPLTIPPGIGKLKITLVWTDPAAAPNASKALVNDLDLSLSLPAAGRTWLPWVLNSSANIDSLKRSPHRESDHLNNIEQVSIDTPLAGDYILYVHGYAVTAFSPQSYSIAYQYDPFHSFEWYYPSSTDKVVGDTTNIIRWHSTYTDSVGKLEYSLDKGNSWQVIHPAVPLSQGYFKWDAPDTNAGINLRMNIGADSFLSDTVTLSRLPLLQVGYNCQDSFLLSWNRMQGVDSFRVFTLGEKYMEKLADVAGTNITLRKAGNPSLYYAVSPLVDGREGLRSQSVDYASENTGCFIKAFEGNIAGNIGMLQLELSTIQDVRSITWQKASPNGFSDLATIPVLQNTRFSYMDSLLTRGINEYRVKIAFNDSKIIYSDPVFLYYLGDENYLIYPNPVSKNSFVSVVSKISGICHLQVFNAIGGKVLEQMIYNQLNFVSIGGLAGGTYFFQFVKDGVLQKTLRVVIY